MKYRQMRMSHPFAKACREEGLFEKDDPRTLRKYFHPDKGRTQWPLWSITVHKPDVDTHYAEPGLVITISQKVNIAAWWSTSSTHNPLPYELVPELIAMIQSMC